MVLVLETVTESLLQRREPVYPRFVEDSRFMSDWWGSPSTKSPVSYCRLLDDGDEVGRAKILPGAGEYSGYETWSCPPGGATEIDRIEVRIDLRRSGRSYGRKLVAEIGRVYGQPVVAMSLDDTSDGFWRSLGWTAHTHPDGDGYATLFTSV